ncbi:hypothetical protein ACVNPS_07175 [Candidatus Bipolaricaulota sp. J31]
MRDLWGNDPPLRHAKFYVFHDESIPSKRWLLIGLTFVDERDLDTVREALRQARSEENYDGEVHFNDLPKFFGGEYGAKVRVALRWMQLYQDRLAESVYFSCLAVDRHSPAFDHSRFRHDFHAYNRFTAMALKAGIAWHLGPKDLDRVTIRFLSDAKDRASRPDQGMVDNFEEYLPYRAELDAFLAQMEGKRYPKIVMASVNLIDSAREDLLQLTDVLLGATQMALVAGSKRPTKRKLGEFVARWCQDLRKPPWKQHFGLHRKFNLWAFPDKNGHPYNDVPLTLHIDDGQLALF